MRRPAPLALTVTAAALLSACAHAPANTAGTASHSPAAPAPRPATTAPAWPRPADQFTQVARARLSLSPQESLTVHYHAHLDVTVDGQPVTVPGGLGINAGIGQELPPHGAPGIAPLHTHDTSGVLHIEAPGAAAFTLGQAFTEWGVALGPDRVGPYSAATSRQVRVYVNGAAVTGDPAVVVLRPHEEILVAVTAPGAPVHAPASYAFQAGE